MTRNLLPLLAGLLLAVSLRLSPARAQTAPALTKSDDETVQLNPFEVSVKAEKEYGVTSLAGATRLNTPIREIPQSVSVITREFMNTMSATNISDISIWVPNMAPRQNVYDGSVIRSFIVFNSYNDGVRNFNGSYQSDLANFQRIEVVKGPAAAVTGIGEAGGFVNRVTKTALESRRYETKFIVGSEQFRRWEFDATGPLVPDKSVLYRTVFAYQNNLTTIPGQSQERTLFAPQVELRPWPKSNVRLQYEYQDVHDPNDFGEAYNPLNPGTAANPQAPQFIFPRKTYTGDTFSGNNNIVQNLRGTWMQNLTKAVQARVLANGFRGDVQTGRAIIGSYILQPNGQRVFTRSYENVRAYIKTWNIQADLLATYKTGPIKHSTLCGYEYIWNRDDRQTMTGSLSPLNPFEPVYGIKPTNLAPTGDQLQQTIQSGMWLQQQSKMLSDRLVLTAGLRGDRASITTKNRLTNTFSRTTPIQEEIVKSPRVGATYAMTAGLSAYGVYSSGKLPATQRRQYPLSATDQTVLTAQTNGELKEVGLKGELWSGRITASVAYFDLKQTGFFQNTTLADGTQVNVIVPGRQIKGTEFEIVASPTTALRLLGAYTQNFKANDMFTGIRTPTTPKQKVSLFARYGFTKSFSAYGGAVYQGDQVSSGGAQVLNGEWLFSAGAEYRLTKQWVAGLSVGNLADKRFIYGLNAAGSNSLAPYRNWKLRLQRNW